MPGLTGSRNMSRFVGTYSQESGSVPNSLPVRSFRTMCISGSSVTSSLRLFVEGEVNYHESAALLGPEVAPKLVREVGIRHPPLDVGHLRRLPHTVLGLWCGLLLSLRLFLVLLYLRLPRVGLLLSSDLCLR